jgi:4-diphosphocytidyl-2-C-methyl-D-erythritol kinase
VSSADEPRVVIRAPAKVNWWLEVLGRRDDGFHEVETVMQAVNLCDTLTVRETSGALQLACSVNLGPLEQNLAFRAAVLLRDEHAPGRGAHLALTKRIPHGAGLGGGSSDAAAALVALNRLWGLGLAAQRLGELAARLGSDCPFFVGGGLAVCTGRGEQVRALPDGRTRHIVLLYPAAVSPTAEVYKALGQGLTYAPQRLNNASVFETDMDDRTLAGLIFNRLAEPAMRVCPALREVWSRTDGLPGVLARFVSGSGSTLVFLADGQQAAVELATLLNGKETGSAFAVRTLPRGPLWG